ncbi:hypothetical protein LCGC14_1280690 [marine sediment metagenome]|uniref:Uncharacterized protein n=1 Tax=marine sediment metagenome TaxID=412755 RepID=A0A0F9NC03_9ZZZZ
MTTPFGSVVGQLLEEAGGSIPYNLPEESIYLESVRGLRTELDSIVAGDPGFVIDPSTIDHDALLNFDQDEHYLQSAIIEVGIVATGTWNADVLTEVYGGTGQSSYILGDTLYSDAANSIAKLAGNTVATKKFLTQVGDGAISAAPAWNTIIDGDIAESSVTQHQAALSIGAAQITAGTFGAGDYVFPADVTTSASFVSTGGGATGKFLTGGAGATVFAFSGANFDIRAGDGMQSSQNVLRVASTGAFDFQSNTVSMGTLTIDDTNEWLLLTDTATSGSVDLTFQNGTTGTGAAGFQIGITTTEKAILLNYENTDMLFHVNNTLAATLAPGGSLTLVGDLFLASGAVINFNSGNMTITHSASKLGIEGGDVGIGLSGPAYRLEVNAALGTDGFVAQFANDADAGILISRNANTGGVGLAFREAASDRLEISVREASLPTFGSDVVFTIAADGAFDFKTGTTKFNTVTYTWPASDGGSGDLLTTNGAGALWWTAGGGGGLGGSGTAGTLSKWSAVSTLTDSIMTESGVTVTVATTLNATTLGGTLSTAAQGNITSLGTLVALTVDNIAINGNTISSIAGTDLLITPLGGQQIVLDGAVTIDGSVVTGITSLSSDKVIVSAADGIVRSVANATTILSGGTTNILGANIVLYGQSHASQAADWELRSATTVRLDWDESDLEFTVHGGIAITGDFTHQGTNIGFFNTAVQPKQQVLGSRSGGAALTNLLIELAQYGLIIDGTSA